MSWAVDYLPEALQDLRELDGSQRLLIRKAIAKVSSNPLPVFEGGYGKPLGNKGGTDLTGLLKIKLRSAGLRVVYTLVRKDEQMLVVVIGARADDEVYEVAEKRAGKYNI